MKIKSREDLQALRDKYRDEVIMRLVSDNFETRTEINVGIGETGLKTGARDTLKTFFDEVNLAKLENVSVIAVDCIDRSNSPVVEIKIPGKEPVIHNKVDSAKAKALVAALKTEVQ
ncbi:MAG: hypothetical protein FWE05_12125 [Defluviitaleaceae bacterium]|nr:hypothetical protein [Defluviitaleaceae bacterium]